MNEDSLKKLISQVANRCYVTSEDKLIQERLVSVVSNAIYSVKSLIGIKKEEKFDFSAPSEENELFLNYCMYRWNNIAQKEFTKNYMGDIISIRLAHKVDQKQEVLEEPSNEG